MSDRAVQSYEESDRMAGQSMLPYQSVWMAHWMQASYKSAPQVHNHLSLQYKIKEDDSNTKQPLLGGLERDSDFSESAKEFKQAPGARAVNTTNESPKTSSKSLRNERQVRSQIDLDSGYDTIALGRNENHLPSFLAWVPPETKFPSGDCLLQSEGTSRNPEQQVKSHKFFEKNFALSRSFQDDFMGSTSNIVPYAFNSGKTPIRALMCGQEGMNQSSSVMASRRHFTNANLAHLEREHCNYHSHSSFLDPEKKIDNHLNSGKSGNSLLRENDRALLLHDPSMSYDQLPVFVGEQFQKMHNHSNVTLFPTRSSPPEVINSEKLSRGCYSVQGMPFSVHDVEAMRISTALDSMEGLPGATPKFLQTTHHFLITKKTDVNLSRGSQIFGESTVSTKSKGNRFGEFLSLSPDFGFRGHQGVKLQPLGSPTDSEGKGNVGDVKSMAAAVNLKNESSAETDIMDMGAFQDKNHLSGVTSSPSNKDLTGAQNAPTSQATVDSAREEVGGRVPKKDLPDINQELPALPAAASSVDEREPSTSRTQSLDVEHLLTHTEQATNSKWSPCPGVAQESEPSSRWVKRLKPSATDSFGHGTKSSKIEASSNEKVNKLFSKIIKCSRTDSEPMMGKRYGKEPMTLDQTNVFLRQGESTSMCLPKKGQDITLSHFWIQRWCHRSAVPQKKPEAMVNCKTQSSKMLLDEFQKKQYPSIAAMALMGKAVSGFRPCEFRKRGSFVVWNTGGL